LQQATSSSSGLRNFAARLKQEKFPAGSQPAIAERIAQAADDLTPAFRRLEHRASARRRL